MEGRLRQLPATEEAHQEDKALEEAPIEPRTTRQRFRVLNFRLGSVIH